MSDIFNTNSLEQIETIYYNSQVGVIKATKDSICRINFISKQIDYIRLPMPTTKDALFYEVAEWIYDKYELREMFIPLTAIHCCIESLRENPSWAWR